MGYLSHYTIFSGLLFLFVAATLSCSFAAWNSDGIIRISSRKHAFYSSLLVCVLFVDLSIWSIVVSPYISGSIRSHPYLYILPACTFLAALSIPFLLANRRFGLSTVMSIIVIIGLSGICFVSIATHVRTIFFENLTPGVLRPSVQLSNRARMLMEYRQKLFPYEIIVMTVFAAIQLYIIHRFRRPVQCPLPYEEDDDSLF
jgi:cytochrome bd-type quinol oxidase subunit 2